MRSHVVPVPPELTSQINAIVARIQSLWNSRNFSEAEPLFREYYEIMRTFEDTLPAGRRLHKGNPLHNWGILILLQDPPRIQEAIDKIFLAYLEDLLDFDTIEQVHSAPAYRTLHTSPIGSDVLNLAQTRVEELINAGRIPKDPQEVFTSELRGATQIRPRQISSNKLKTVFVVHGRNLEARDSMFTFLKSLSLNPINLAEAMLKSGKVTPYIGELLDFAFSLAQAVLVLMTPDDIGCLRQPFRKTGDSIHDTKFTPQARLNVIFEAGMAMGGKFRKRTILVELGQLRQLSDWGGLFVVRLDNSIAKRQDLITRLRNCGCRVSYSRNTWRQAGDFETVITHNEGLLHRLILSCL